MGHLSRANLRKLAKLAIKEFDLYEPRLRYLAEHTSVLFSVTDGDGQRFVLKIARSGEHSEKELLGGLFWLEKLQHISPFPATKPIRTSRGSLFATVAMSASSEVITRNCMLFTWVPGVSLYNRLSKPIAFKWGRLLALLHQQSRKIAASAETKALPRYDRVFNWEERVLSLHKPCELFSRHRITVFNKAISVVGKAISRLSSSAPIVIHGDLHPDNIRLFGRELYALDFADCTWGYPVQDVSIALLYVRERRNYGALRKAFHEGYGSIQPWPEEHSGQIETFFMGRLLVIANALVKEREHSENKCESIHQRLARYEREFERYLK